MKLLISTYYYHWHKYISKSCQSSIWHCYAQSAVEFTKSIQSHFSDQLHDRFFFVPILQWHFCHSNTCLSAFYPLVQFYLSFHVNFNIHGLFEALKMQSTRLTRFCCATGLCNVPSLCAPKSLAPQVPHSFMQQRNYVEVLPTYRMKVNLIFSIPYYIRQPK